MEQGPRQWKGARAAHQRAAQTMVEGINQEIDGLLGRSAGDALRYYADPRVAAEAPLRYQSDIRGLLGPASQSVIRRLRDKMCEISGTRPKEGCVDLAFCLECVQRSIEAGLDFPDYQSSFQCVRTRIHS